MHSSLAERFWAKVDKSAGPDACWPWLGCRSKQGHGHFKIGLAMRTTMSVSLELTTGEPAAGRYGLHTCDNPPCCNPKHGYWGSHDDNMRDKVDRGRTFHPVGEINPSARLTEDLVRELRARYIPRHRVNGACAMAREFGVSESAVGFAVTGRHWGHVT